jgi:hypothetical protein
MSLALLLGMVPFALLALGLLWMVLGWLLQQRKGMDWTQAESLFDLQTSSEETREATESAPDAYSVDDNRTSPVVRTSGSKSVEDK